MPILRSEGGENPGSIRSEHVGRGGLLGRSVGNTKTRGSTGCQILASQTRVAFASMGEIDETVLPNLTAEDLKDLGVGIVGHRRKLLDAIAALRHRRERERALAA